MKKIFLLITFIIISTSCNRVVYSTELDVKKQGVNFREDNWLLGEIDCPIESKSDIRININSYLTKILKGRYSSFPTSKTPILSKPITLDPNKETLEKIKKETIFDFLINIKAEKLKEQLNIIDITNHKYNKNLKNTVVLTLEIYDLKNVEIVYSKKYFATSSISESNNSDINFVKTTNKLIIGALKKIIKDLDSKSLK